MGRGWYNDRNRHYLSAMGVNTRKGFRLEPIQKDVYKGVDIVTLGEKSPRASSMKQRKPIDTSKLAEKLKEYMKKHGPFIPDVKILLLLQNYDDPELDYVIFADLMLLKRSKHYKDIMIHDVFDSTTSNHLIRQFCVMSVVNELDIPKSMKEMIYYTLEFSNENRDFLLLNAAMNTVELSENLPDIYNRIHSKDTEGKYNMTVGIIPLYLLRKIDIQRTLDILMLFNLYEYDIPFLTKNDKKRIIDELISDTDIPFNSTKINSVNDTSIVSLFSSAGDINKLCEVSKQIGRIDSWEKLFKYIKYINSAYRRFMDNHIEPTFLDVMFAMNKTISKRDQKLMELMAFISLNENNIDEWSKSYKFSINKIHTVIDTIPYSKHSKKRFYTDEAEFFDSLSNKDRMKLINSKAMVELYECLQRGDMERAVDLFREVMSMFPKLIRGFDELSDYDIEKFLKKSIAYRISHPSKVDITNLKEKIPEIYATIPEKYALHEKLFILYQIYRGMLVEESYRKEIRTLMHNANRVPFSLDDDEKNKIIEDFVNTSDIEKMTDTIYEWAKPTRFSMDKSSVKKIILDEFKDTFNEVGLEKIYNHELPKKSERMLKYILLRNVLNRIYMSHRGAQA